MARVNVEESIFGDTRYQELVLLCGNKDTAIGMLIHAWRVGQSFYKDTLGGIPIAAWKNHGLNNLIIEVGLAQIDGDFVFVKGYKTHFQWLLDRKKAGRNGGLVSAARRSVIAKENFKQTQANASKSKPLTLSLNTNTVSTFGLTQLDVPPVETPDQIDPLVKIWEQHRGKLPSVKKLSASRKRKCVLRWKEGTAGEWEEAVRKLAASDFCNGKNENGWRASFDFLLRPDTLAKALEGVYDNKKSNMSQIKIMEFTQK